MKKKAIILLLTSAVLTSAMAGCGCGSGNADDNTNDNGANITETEEITANDTETVFDTENATSQLQLGNATSTLYAEKYGDYESPYFLSLQLSCSTVHLSLL